MALESISRKGTQQSWNVIALIRWATGYFEKHGIDSPRMTAELLLSHALGVGRLQLYLRHDQPLSAAELAEFKALIQRRIKREPTAYILGKREFWSRNFNVNPSVLIPRPETEHLVEAALTVIDSAPKSKKMRVLDLGTGSGAIILSLAAERPGHVYVASDKREEAVRVAKINAEKNGVAETVLFFVGRWLDPVTPGYGGFDVIVSNPPYIQSGDIGGLQPEVADFEPRHALDGGLDGLDEVREIMKDAPMYLKEGGSLILEIGFGQAEKIRSEAAAGGIIKVVQIFRDLAGIERVVKMSLQG